MMRILVASHMAELNDAALASRALRARSIILDKEISRLQARLAEKKLVEEKEKLMKVHETSGMDML